MNVCAQGPLIFHTRRGAVIALCVGILFTLKSSRYLFELCVPGHTTWLTRYRFSPTFFDIVLHLWCAVLGAAALIFILRRTRSGERAFLASFVGVVVPAPLSDVPLLASVHLVAWIAALLELALIPSAIWMYRTLPSHLAQSEPKSSTTR
jgi:hypothetical protein